MDLKTLFVVDDNDVNLVKAKQVLDGFYRVLTLPSASKMFSLLKKITPDLILLDVEMPEMDGFTALEKLKENPKTADIPVIILTAHKDEYSEAHGFKLGAVDFISKPFSTEVLLNRMETHLNIDGLIKKRTEKIMQLKNGIISVIADIVESRDEITGGHVERTTTYLKLMINAMKSKGIYAEEIEKWDLSVVIPSARLHDVGKIKVSDVILNKPSSLTTEEFEIMKKHAIDGEQIIEQMITKIGEESFLLHAKLFAGYHHEWWNGKGYSRGLKGEEIPLQGRIMAIVDVYDALVSDRPYKKAFTHEKAVEIINNDKGTHFDPQLVDIFMSVSDELAKNHI